MRIQINQSKRLAEYLDPKLPIPLYQETKGWTKVNVNKMTEKGLETVMVMVAGEDGTIFAANDKYLVKTGHYGNR